MAETLTSSAAHSAPSGAPHSAPHTNDESSAPRHVVLLVDDDPNVLAGLTLHLRRRYEVITAPSGGAALAAFQTGARPAVIISDMNMPGIDGALLLSTVRQINAPTVRILLTGQANITSAIAAINDGQIFRFLTKPCPPALLLSTVEAAVAHHDLLTSERVLLQETLLGSVEALTEVLSLTNPLSFGRALRVKQLVAELAQALNLGNVWQIEIAAMFFHLGHVTLPADVAEKLFYGQELNAEEAAMMAGMPAVTDRLLAHIPRLGQIRAILSRVARLTDAAHPFHDDATSEVRVGSQLLDLALRFTQIESRGESAEGAVSLLRARSGWYEAPMLDALQTLRCGDGTVAVLHEIPVAFLQAGMILGDALHMDTGQLLAPRGYVVTESFVQRCRNTREGTIVEPVRIVTGSAGSVAA
ncbi:MAG: response regulator [Gemmatimonadaceae bacterium]